MFEGVLAGDQAASVGTLLWKVDAVRYKDFFFLIYQTATIAKNWGTNMNHVGCSETPAGLRKLLGNLS